MLESDNTPVGVDPTRAFVARVYDYLLGGKDNFDVDRHEAERIIAAMPEVPDVAWENRNFLTRVCRFLANNTEVRQFLDCGSGLPTAENVHQVVQRFHPEAKVVYIDYDPVVAAHGRALLEENNNTKFVQADIFEPETILDNPEVLGALDWSQPIALLFVAALHHYTGDRSRPAEVTKQFIDRLPPGSFVVISHVLDPDDGSEYDSTLQATLEVIRRGSMRDITARTKTEIRELFHELEIIPSGAAGDADVVPVAEWWPDGPRFTKATIAQQIIAGGVARKL
ncbi:SAM-dependent methyltransferase [Amycolatopsis carbonis]|uniref:SAM-dependent methyltransferase n=1 Tax=Amycolatopsis carbonis TaxID=715471 RepID=A0A9Y2IS66_9PSEU|nr:SAM-dependent methyltransferase [Amycolatopsis sp. 2-15]WIX84186.1 SAM-dependent methyltransferase [Amycolatopsis sp. 2-15]